jgi:hypothetical protein
MDVLQMTKTTAALLVLLTLGSAACTASTSEPFPAMVTETAATTETAPAEIVGTWQYTTVQGSGSSWTFEADGAVTHVLVVTSGPDACRRTATTVYGGSMELTGRTLEYTATRATETIVDCEGTTTAPAKGYAETLTYEMASPTALVLREVSKCQQMDRASKDAFCRTTFAKK